MGAIVIERGRGEERRGRVEEYGWKGRETGKWRNGETEGKERNLSARGSERL
jgi:hypothetical protein